MALDQLALGVHGQVRLGDRPEVVGTEPAVVLDPVGPHLALEVPVRPRHIGSEGGDGGVEVGAAHPAELGEGTRHPIGRQVLEDLEGGHQLEGPVRPGEAGEQVGHPDVTHRPGRGVVDGEPTDVASLCVDTPLPQHLDQEPGGTADIEGIRHLEVPPQEPSGDVGIGGDPVVARIPRSSGTISRSVTPFTEVAAPVGVGDARLLGLGERQAAIGGLGQFASGDRHHPTASGVPAGHVDEGPSHDVDGRFPSGARHGCEISRGRPDQPSAGHCHSDPLRRRRSRLEFH